MRFKLCSWALFSVISFSLAQSNTDIKQDSSMVQVIEKQVVPVAIGNPEAPLEDDVKTTGSNLPSEEDKYSDLDGRISGIEEPFLELKSTVEKQNKLKISGYIQAQYRYASSGEGQKDASGNYAGKYNYAVGDYAGGKFGNDIQGMFQIRRGRVKTTYKNGITSAVLQMDIIPKGLSVKDAYFTFTEPWLKSLGIKGGLFDRPFGFEISYSSSKRESPERSRLFQTMFPGERDLGILFSYLPSDNLPSWARLFNFKAGVFNGNGIADDNDNAKDVIGRLGLSIPLYAANLSIDGGFSAYRGNVTSSSDTVYNLNTSLLFTPQSGNQFDEFPRRYYGGDLQIYYGIPYLGGIYLRGELIGGIQPGSASSTKVFSRAVGTNIYNRNFLGYYSMLVQNIDPLNSQLVLKYDVYDPNVDVNGDNVTLVSGLTNTELKYSTFGAGLVYHLHSNIKLILYYDHITNEQADKSLSENSRLEFYTNDLKDDVLTVRMQYKF